MADFKWWKSRPGIADSPPNLGGESAIAFVNFLFYGCCLQGEILKLT
jgi:hypothetical protein